MSIFFLRVESSLILSVSTLSFSKRRMALVTLLIFWTPPSGENKTLFFCWSSWNLCLWLVNNAFFSDTFFWTSPKLLLICSTSSSASLSWFRTLLWRTPTGATGSSLVTLQCGNLDIKNEFSFNSSVRTSYSWLTCLSNMSISFCSSDFNLSWSRDFVSCSIFSEMDLSLSSWTRISFVISSRRGCLFIESRLSAAFAASLLASSTSRWLTRAMLDNWLPIVEISFNASVLVELLRLRS